MPELVLVTGGTGYIAGWCIAELLERGYDVRTTVRSRDKEHTVTTAITAAAHPPHRLDVRRRRSHGGRRVGRGGRGRRLRPARRGLAARFSDPSLRDILPGLGRRSRHSTEKARRVFGWQPRPARETVLDCARSLIEHNALES